jgi:hypothetical protein
MLKGCGIKTKHVVAGLTMLGMGWSFAAQAAFTDLDTSFASSGQSTLIDPSTKTRANITDATQGSDSNLYLIVGTNEIARLTPAGAVDTSFATNGFLTLAGTAQYGVYQYAAIAVDVNGKRIYLASNQSAPNGVAQIAAYDFSGNLVSSFGTNGVVSFSTLGALALPTSLQLLNSGNLLLAGDIAVQSGDRSFFAAEVTASGVPVSGFGTSGAASIVIPGSTRGVSGTVVSYKATKDASGNVYVVGGSSGTVGLIARFTASGKPDSSFGTNGVVAQSLGANAAEFELISVDSSGNINAYGSYYPTSSTGTAVLDSFSSSGVMTASQSGTDAYVPFYPNYALQADGKILFVSGQQSDSDTSSASAANIVRLTGSSLLATAAPKTATITTSGGAVTIAPSAGGVTNAQTTAQPANAPTNVTYPFGWMAYNVTGLTPGASVQVTLTLPAGAAPTGYEKCENGTCTALSSSVLSINGNTLVLTLTDGGFGDADGVANGTIVDPGAPTVASTTSTSTSPSPTSTTNSGDSGGSVDMEMILPLLALGVIRLRRKRVS